MPRYGNTSLVCKDPWVGGPASLNWMWGHTPVNPGNSGSSSRLPWLHSKFEGSLGCKQKVSDDNMTAVELPRKKFVHSRLPTCTTLLSSNHRKETEGKWEASRPCQLPAHMEESQPWDSVERQDSFLAERY